MPSTRLVDVPNVSWRFAWMLINVRREEIEAEADESPGRGKVDLVPRDGGGFHPPGISQLFRTFS